MSKKRKLWSYPFSSANIPSPYNDQGDLIPHQRYLSVPQFLFEIPSITVQLHKVLSLPLWMQTCQCLNAHAHTHVRPPRAVRAHTFLQLQLWWQTWPPLRESADSQAVVDTWQMLREQDDTKCHYPGTGPVSKTPPPSPLLPMHARVELMTTGSTQPPVAMGMKLLTRSCSLSLPQHKHETIQITKLFLQDHGKMALFKGELRGLGSKQTPLPP